MLFKNHNKKVSLMRYELDHPHRHYLTARITDAAALLNQTKLTRDVRALPREIVRIAAPKDGIGCDEYVLVTRLSVCMLLLSQSHFSSLIYKHDNNRKMIWNRVFYAMVLSTSIDPHSCATYISVSLPPYKR